MLNRIHLICAIFPEIAQLSDALISCTKVIIQTWDDPLHMMDPSASPPDPTPPEAEVLTTSPYLHLLTNYIVNESAN